MDNSIALLQRYQINLSLLKIYNNNNNTNILSNQLILNNKKTLNAIQLIKNYVKNLILNVICPICLEIFIDPRILLCGHSICFVCATQMRELNCKI